MARGEPAIGKIKKGIHYSWKTIDMVMERDLHRSLVLSLIWISILLLGNFLQAFGNYIRGRINAMSNRYFDKLMMERMAKMPSVRTDVLLRGREKHIDNLPQTFQHHPG